MIRTIIMIPQIFNNFYNVIAIVDTHIKPLYFHFQFAFERDEDLNRRSLYLQIQMLIYFVCTRKI